MPERKHDIRLAVLAALEPIPFPVALDRLASDLRIQAAGVSRAEILAELPGLIGHGYVADALARQAPLNALRITVAGRDQVRRDAPMDPYVYGEIAL